MSDPTSKLPCTERGREIQPESVSFLLAWRNAMHACPISDPPGTVNHDDLSENRDY